MHSQPQCRLFSLPTEIRLTIYEYAFAFPSTDDDVPLIHAAVTYPMTYLALLETCRRISDEAYTTYLDAFRHFWLTNHLAISHT